MKISESTFPHGLLNREELAFLLRLMQQDNDNTLEQTQKTDGNFFANRMGEICRSQLSMLLPRSPKITVDNELPDESTPVIGVFAEDGGETTCRLTNHDAALLVAAALGNAAEATSAPLRGLSLAIIRRLLKTIIQAAAQARSEAEKEAKKHLTATLSTLCLRLDIHGKEAKIYLSFHSPQMPEKNAESTNDGHLASVEENNNDKLILTAHTPLFLLSAKEISQWKKGAWIPLPFAPDDPILLSAAGMPTLKAAIGRKGSRIAVKLINKVK